MIVGDMGVGKTNLLTRYKNGRLPISSSSTIGVEFATCAVEYNGVTIKA